ncbi:MAG: FAD-dependent oxidoreductase [Opitutaceae bacterium]|nr:FAD-dependent oxidoreductase [Opitutaceae bacterium]
MNKTLTLPVTDGGAFDIVIVGGGTTGIAAAVAAARDGAKVCLVEYYGFLGGNATTGLPWMAYHNLSGQRVVGGVAYEFIERLREVGGASDFYMDPVCSSTVAVNPHWWKLVSMQEVKKAGIAVKLHSLVVNVETVPGAAGRRKVNGVYLTNKGGVQFIAGQIVMDCTDSGDIARMAGATMVKGRAGDQKTQVSSYTVTFGGIDVPALLDYFRKNPDDIRPFPIDNIDALLAQMAEAEIFIIGGLRKLIAKARADGFELPRGVVPGLIFPKTGEMTTVATCIEGLDPTDPEAFTRAEQEGMRQTQLWLKFFRAYVPGYAHAHLCGTPHQIGIRETYHMADAEYVVTGDDLKTGRKFDDVISLGGYHVDIHAPNRDGHNDHYVGPPTFQIPYRSLLPKHIDGLLVVGRAFGATHEAQAATRVIPLSMAQGQGGGQAAALAVEKGCELRDIDVAELQRRLLKQGQILDHTGLPRHPRASMFKVATVGGHVNLRDQDTGAARAAQV